MPLSAIGLPIGLIADLFFPHIFKKTKSRILIFWGIYYELVAFARFQFVGSVVPANMRTGSWGIMGTFTNLAYFLGPLIAVEILYVKSNLFVEGGKPLNGTDPLVYPFEKRLAGNCLKPLNGFYRFNFLDNWSRLDRKTFFSRLCRKVFPAYVYDSIATEKLLIFAGVFLLGLSFGKTIELQLAMVFFASLAISVAYPLLDGVYSDIVARMGKDWNIRGACGCGFYYSSFCNPQKIKASPK